MDIKVDNLTGPEIAELLKEHLQSMAQHSPPESIHALDLEELRKPANDSPSSSSLLGASWP